MEQDNSDITTIGEGLWVHYVVLQKKIDHVLKYIKELKLPPVKTDILKATDAGPGVGCSNFEVRYRDVEMARIFDSDCVNRIHRARDDSGQNEAERSNACIGEALVDGGSIKWKYHDAFDGLTKAEIKQLSVDGIQKREALSMEQNAWRVARDVAERINHEPGPAGDYVHSTKEQAVFFFLIQNNYGSLGQHQIQRRKKYLVMHTSRKSIVSCKIMWR